MAEELKLPKFLSSQEKYNKLIRETNTLKKFEDIYMKLLSDEDLEMDSILGLMKIIERDVILVNELNEATALMEMTETFIKYMMMKEEEKRKPGGFMQSWFFFLYCLICSAFWCICCSISKIQLILYHKPP